MRNKYYYLNSRRFIEVFPTYNRFKEQIDPYLNTFPTDPEDIEKNKETIYNRLKLRFGSSFFRYARIGTILDATTSFFNTLIPYYIRLNALEKMELNDLNRLSTYSENRNFLTDNTKTNNIDGYESEVNTYSTTGYGDINQLSKDIFNLRKNIEDEYNKYNINFLKDIQDREYERLYNVKR